MVVAEKPLTPIAYSFGTLGFRGWLVPSKMTPWAVPDDSSGSRGGRGDVRALVLDDLSGGYLSDSSILSARYKNLIWYSEGVYGTWQKGKGTLPYALTTQADIQLTGASVDLSGSGGRAGNIRRHAVMSSLGSASGARYYEAVGKRLYRDTSTSNPALVAKELFTDNLTAMAEMVWASTAYLCIAGADTEDIEGTVDPTAAGAITWVKLMTLTAGDYINCMYYLPGLHANVILGKIGGVQGVYYVLDSEAVPATPHLVVATDTKDTFDPNAPVVSYGPRYPADVDVFTNAANAGTNWGSDSTPDDGNLATASGDTGSGEFGADIHGYKYTFEQTGMPDNLRVTGIVARIEAAEGNANDNMTFGDANIVFWTDTGINGGYGHANQNTAELTVDPTFTVYTFGRTNDTWRLTLTGEDIKKNSFGTYFNFTVPGGTGAWDVSVDYLDCTIYGQLPGTSLTQSSSAAGSASAPGGCGIGVDPAHPNRVYFLPAERDDATGVTVPRHLAYIEFAADSNAGRITGSYYPVNTGGLPYVQAAWYYQGGLMFFGGPNANTTTSLSVISSSGELYKVAGFGLHGPTAVLGIFGVADASGGSILGVATAAADDFQLWRYFDGKLYPFGVLQSKVSSIALLPLACAEFTLGTLQNQLYYVFPKTTKTNASYTFVPPDLDIDPNIANLTQVKADGPLYTQVVELDGGPTSALRTLLTVRHDNRYVSATSGAYGTVGLKLDLGGDRTVTSAEVSVTVPTDKAAFTPYNIVSTRDPGLSYSSIIARITADNARSGSVKSPNILPWELTYAIQWPFERTMRVMLHSATESPLAMQTQLETLQASKVAQRFVSTPAHLDRAAIVTDFDIVLKPGADPTLWESVDTARSYVELQLVPGATS